MMDQRVCAAGEGVSLYSANPDSIPGMHTVLKHCQEWSLSTNPKVRQFTNEKKTKLQ